MGGDGDWVGGVSGNFREITGYSNSPIIKIGLVKRQIKVFTIGLWGNYPTIMVDPPVEYLKMCNFPQISPFPETFIYEYSVLKHMYSAEYNTVLECSVVRHKSP